MTLRHYSRIRTSPARNVLVRYHGDIAKFLLEMENLNIQTRVTRIPWRKMIENQIPKEGKSLQGGDPSGVTMGDKRKFEDSKLTATARHGKKQYVAKEKADYKAKMAGERKVKKEGSVVPTREVRHRVYAEAYKGLHQNVVDKDKKDDKRPQCRMNNHTWKYCQKPVPVSALYRSLAKPKGQA